MINTDAASRVDDAVSAMVTSIKERCRADAENLTVADLSLFARPSECLELMTIHFAKGSEFDAVAVIDLLDGVLPHWRDDNEEAVEDSKRRLYVAATRARRLLFFLSHDHRRYRPSRFLGAQWLGYRNE